MNYSMISYILGWIFNFEAAFMILPGITAIIYREKKNGLAFLITMLICLTIGIPLTRRKRKSKVFHAKEGAVTVALSWLVLSIAGALPFIISGSIPHPIDAIFETVSGFTTTGASILSDVEALSHCMLIWRSFTHWIGGMGVLVFLLAVIRMTGGSHMNLMRAESTGPSVGKLVPKVRHSARTLYYIYTGMTIIMIILLLAGRMPVFDALTTAFGTAGTGGFGIKADSMASYSPYLQWVVAIFMILFGVNFKLLFSAAFEKADRSLKKRGGSVVFWHYCCIDSGDLCLCPVHLSNCGGGVPSFCVSGGIDYHHHGICRRTDFNLWGTGTEDDPCHADVHRCLCRKYRRRYQGIQNPDPWKDNQKGA